MATVNGYETVVKLGTSDITEYIKSVEFSNETEALDVTTMGKSSKVYAAGLKDGTCTLEGNYDNTESTGPGAVIRPLKNGGTVFEFTYQPEGTGTGKPEFTVDALVTSYVETSAVEDVIRFSCELQLSDDVTETAQSA